MSLYTKNGKLIVKSENGVLKLVTGDCCCGCESPSKCGLPHTVVELFIVSASGTWADPNGHVDVSLSFTLSGAQTEKGMVVIRGTPTATETAWAVLEEHGPFSWATNCPTDKCSTSSRTSHVRMLSADPELDVYSLGVARIDVQSSRGAFQEGATITMTADVTRTFQTKILDPEATFRRAGDQFTMEFSAASDSKSFTIMSL